MSAKDSQFIERALAHPWMFWVFFWKWPRILRQVCSEYDLVAKDRDVAKAAHEQAVEANKKVRNWIHVTHQLDATADLRAIWTAGKKLSALIALFIATNAFGQAPPYLRNQWTTNANPIAVKVISTNGVQVATNVWEVDFTNTATVTVEAVSNANKVMVSFTGSASSGSSSLTNALLHAGPTNGSVSPLILTAGNGVTLTTSGTNRLAAIDTNVVAEITDLLWTNIAVAQPPSGTEYVGDILASLKPFKGIQIVTNRLSFWGDWSSLTFAGYKVGDLAKASTNASAVVGIGDYAFDGASLTSDSALIGIGFSPFAAASINTCDSILGFGDNCFLSSKITNTTDVLSVGKGFGGAVFNNSSLILGIGTFVGRFGVFESCNNIVSVGQDSLRSSILSGSDNISTLGYRSLYTAQITNSQNLTFIGANCGTNVVATGLTNLVVVGNQGARAITSADNNSVIFGDRVTVDSGATNSITLLDTNGSTYTKLYSQGGVLYSSASPPYRTVDADAWVNVTNVANVAITNLSHSPLASGQIAITNGNTGFDRKLKSLQAGSNVTITDEGTNLVIEASGGSGSGIPTENGIGTNTTLQTFKQLSGTNISVQAMNVTATQTNTSDASAIPLVIKGPASHIASSFQILTNSGATNFAIASNGVVQVKVMGGAAQIQVPGLGTDGDGIALQGATTDLIQSGLPRIRFSAGAIETTGFIGIGVSGSIGNPKVSISQLADAHLRIGTGVGSGFATITASNGFFAGSLNVTSTVAIQSATASRVTVFNANKELTNSAAVDTTELEYLDGVTSAIQGQLDGKQVGSAALTNLAATKAVTNITITAITNVGVSLYTVPAGVKYIFVECLGGGGGGGGVDGATSQSAAGGGGGSGAYCSTNIVSPAASYIVTVGTNGLGGAAGNNNGTIGGTTTFTNILTALGGSGGSGDASAAAVGFAIGGAGALETATGAFYSGGTPGGNGICVSATLAVSGGGAGTIYGGGGASQTAAVGGNATGKGAGGGGAAVITNADRAGGNGSPGMIMIREYYQ